MHCYCPEERNLRELSLPAIEQLLAEFSALGGFRLHLTGGEPMLRPDLPEILRAAARIGLVVDLLSNLTLLDRDLLDVLEEVRPRSVGCSVYSADPRIHDAVTKMSGSLDRTLAGVRALRSRGIPVVLKTPLMRDTLSGWRGVENLAESLGCEHQMDLSITPRNDGGDKPLPLRATDDAAIRDSPIESLLPYLCQRRAFHQERLGQHRCRTRGAGGAGLAISPDGTIRPCIGLMDALGRYPANRLGEVWEGSPWFDAWARRRLADIPSCSSCDSVPFCNRCPGAWALETGRVDRPSEYTCFLARTWKSVNS